MASSFTSLTPQDRTFWANADSLPGNSPLTPLGDQLRSALSKSRGQPLAGVFLVTDGQNNSGNAPIAAAESAALQNVPLFNWGVGLPTARDIVIASVFAPDVCFINDDVPVVVRLRAAGLVGESGKIQLKLGGEVVAQQDVAFADGEQVISINVKPTKAGDFELAASIDPRADEIVKDNNQASQKIRVVDGKIKVLLVDQQPRWEYQYLVAMLARDRRVDLKVFLAEADESVSRDEKGPFLSRFPRTKEELFKFDLVILGDLDPHGFSQVQLEWVAEFVSKFGGGLVTISGRRFGINGWTGTAIEKLLPVEPEPGETGKTGEVNDKPIRMELTSVGERNQMLRLSDQEVENKRIWTSLPPIYWTARVQRAKPAAEVLIADPSPEKAYRGQKMPIMAIQQYGMGQVLFSGTDNTWRWRRNVGDKHYSAMWGQIVQRMSLPHLLGESKRTQLSSDKKTYSTGDRVTIFARLYDEAYSPIKDPVVRGTYAMGSSQPGEVMLRAMPDQPGMYRGDFVAAAPGKYDFKVQRDDKTKLEIDITEPRVEMGETTMNEPLLREMAKITGGQFLYEDDLHKLPDMVKAKTELVRSKLDVEVWSSPLYFAMIVAVAGTEWALRKKWQLK